MGQGVGMISVINHYYGRDDIRIGAYKGPFNNPGQAQPGSWIAVNSSGPYVNELVPLFPSPIKNSSQVPDAIEVYKSALAGQPDNSVVIVSIGFLSNLAALLKQGGASLVAQKVRAIAMMGGIYPFLNRSVLSGRLAEWNFGGACGKFLGNVAAPCPDTPRFTKSTLDGLPPTVPLVFSGFEMGRQVFTGGRISNCTSSDNPIRAAFEKYHSWDEHCPPRNSWDPATTLFAVMGLGEFWDQQEGGHNEVNGTTGANKWVHGSKTQQSYLVLKNGMADKLGLFMDGLLCAPPDANSKGRAATIWS